MAESQTTRFPEADSSTANADSTADWVYPGLSGLVSGDISVIGDPLGLFSGPRVAAALAANAERRALNEQGRQFDITQSQYEPWRQAGLQGLSQYERMLSQYDDYDVPSNLPGAFKSSMGIPSPYDFQSGDYFSGIQNNVPGGFEFGQDQFEQYKNPGYEFNKEEELRALDRTLASRGKRKAGVRGRALMEAGQGLADEEWNAARGRALGDYNSQVGREQDAYGRSVDQYGRNVSREADMYGRGYNQYADQVNQEAELYNRDLRDYASRVGREESTYVRGLEDYARNYVDPLNQYAQLAGQGQATTFGLASLRNNYTNNLNQGISNIGNIQAAGVVGTANARSSALSAAGNIASQYWGNNNTYVNTPYGQQVQGDAYMPAAQYGFRSSNETNSRGSTSSDGRYY